MKDTIEAEEGCFIGVAEVARDFSILEIDWWERDNEGEERRVKVWEVPQDVKQAIRRKLVEEAAQMEEDSRHPDPMSLSHEWRENQ